MNNFQFLKASIYKYKRGFLILTFVFTSFLSFSEGTKELWPTGNGGDIVGLQIWDNADTERQFATYGCDEKYRLNITISHSSETMYFGFNENGSTSGKGDLYFQIKDELGNIVYGPTLVPTAAGPGFINLWSEANAGPQSLVGASGYNDLSFSPGTIGTFYIEFNPDNPTAPISVENRRLEFFDLTVANGTSVKTGRLHSSNWDLTTYSFGNTARSELYVYSPDGVVSKMSLNGIQPYGFEVQCNGTGPQNTGSPFTDRQSKSGKLTYADYKIFLNDPDINEFPTGSFSGLGSNPAYLDGCSGTYCVNVDYTSSGYAEILLDFNGNGINDGVDVLLVKNVVSGYNCFAWDGNDLVGTPITHGFNMSIKSTVLAGMTHYPVYDAENHTAGFMIDVVRPTGLPQPVLFYDDTQIGGGIDLTGCTAPCHTWTGNFGNVVTINTWWYGLSIEENVTLLNNQCSPVGVNDTITGSENTPLNIDVLNIGVDYDSDGDDIWPASAGTDGIDGNSYAGGTVVINDNGTPGDLTDDYIVYTPATDFSGLDSSYYFLEDDMGGVDTVLIYIFINGDTDNDGIADNLDLDSDNDGILDSDEDSGTGFNPSLDSDGDGFPNYLDNSDATPGFPAWADVNGDGINDNYDTDLDGVPDFLDLDADNDGIPDLVEAGGVDTDGDGVIDSSTDSDNDGLMDVYDVTAGGDAISNSDSDGDGINDFLDKDSDNDGILDVLEAGGTDANGDGVIDGYTDADGDGFADSVDGDADNNGFAENSSAALQLTGTDGNSDGIPDSYPEGDFDGDGNLDQLDIDSDNDGIVDNVEAQAEGSYTAPTGTDTDGDGIDNAYDTNSGNAGLIPTDTDSDGITDHKDDDSDNDSILDVIEGHDANSDGVADTSPSGSDSDGDGLDDAYDTSAVGPGNSTGSNSPLQDFNSNSNRDWRDSDDDGDGNITIDETADLNTNGIPDYLETSACPPRTVCVACALVAGNADSHTTGGVGTPLNSLGAPDGAYASVNNGDNIILDLTDIIPIGETVVITIARRQTTAGLSSANIEQSLDGVSFSNLVNYSTTVSQPTYQNVNYVITGLTARYIRITRTASGNALDAVSYSYMGGCIADWDMDGISDALDLDDDNDGIPDSIEGTIDTDGDGLSDSNDLDSDNDGIPDAIEANGGTIPANMLSQGYYSVAYISNPANDPNGDGWIDATEGGPAYSVNGAQLDTDADGLADYIDLDADGDGITDAVEANDGVLPANMDSNGQYPAAYATANDSDGDGLMDDIDLDAGGSALPNNDFDLDGKPNYLDDDSDGDGISDLIEGFDPDITLTGVDSDNDGNDNAYDPESGNPMAGLPDLNCNGIMDYLDGTFDSQVSGNYNTSSTWAQGFAPVTSNNIVVKTGHIVNITQATVIGSVNVESGATLNLGGYDIEIKGNLLIDGTLNVNASIVTLDGTCNQTIAGNIGFDDLIIDNTNGVTITSGTVTVGGIIDLESGVLDVTSANSFTLTSNSSSGGTASLDGTGSGTISGTVTVERYKEGCQDGFLTLSTPFTGNTPSDWGDDLLITGIPNGPWPAFWTSLYYYDETVTSSFLDGWTSPTDYNTDLLVRGRGYYLYAGIADLPAKLIVSGTLDLSPFIMPLSFTNSGVQDEDGFNLIGNPFPSAIDWHKESGWTKTGCCDAVWVWNECVNQFASALAGSETNGGSTVVESGQGFWIKAHNNTASLQITRDACTQESGDFRASQQGYENQIKIHVDGFSQEDECVVRYLPTASHGHDDNGDAVNMLSDMTNMAIYTTDDDGMDCSINSFPYDGLYKEIPVMLRVPDSGSFTMDFEYLADFPEEVCLTLRDNQDSSLIDIRSNPFYTFSMNAESLPENRFTLFINVNNSVITQDITCHNANDGMLIFNPQGSIGPFNVMFENETGDTIYNANSTLQADTLFNLPSGSYFVSVEDLSGTTCGSFSTEYKIINPKELKINSVSNNISCDGLTLG